MFPKILGSLVFLNVFFGLGLFSFSQENTAKQEGQKVLFEDEIAAVVNEEVITSNALDERINLIKSVNKTQASKDKPSSIPESLRKNAIEQLIEETILLQEAKKQNITVTDEELEPTRVQILISKLLSREVDSRIEVSDSEIASYYEANKNLFVEPERVKIDEVFLMVRPGSKLDEWQSAQKGMEELYLKVKDSSDFAMMAKELDNRVSIGRSGFLKMGELPPEVEEFAFSSPTGKLSPLVKSPIGFHIVRVVDKKEARQKDLTEVKEDIRDIIFKLKARQRYEEWIAKLKASSNIDVREDKAALK